MILSITYRLYNAVQRRHYNPYVIDYYSNYVCIEYKHSKYRYYETIFDNKHISEASVVVNMNLVCVFDTGFKFFNKTFHIIIHKETKRIELCTNSVSYVIIHHSKVHCNHTTTCIRAESKIISEKQLNLIKNRYYP